MGGNGNRLLPVIAAVVLLLLAAVFTRSGNKESGKTGPHTAPAPDADTAADTLRAMAVQLTEVKSQAEQARKDAELLRRQQAEESARVRSELQNAQKASEGRDKENRELVQRLEQAARRLAPGASQPGQQPSQTGDMPVGGNPGGNAAAGLVWVEPLDRQGQGISALPPATSSATGQSLLHDGSEPPPPKPKPDEPAYTIPRNATLVGSTAMTALVGRVPVKGSVEDPFPFKVLVGQDNLAANGLEIPGVFGMVFSGTAMGDWTLGCVRGNVDSVTFVFEDGRVRTVSSDGGQGGQGGQSGGGGTAGASVGAAAPGLGTQPSGGGLSGAGLGPSGNAGSPTTLHKGLGWISDRRGIPCVSGVRISNATDYLAGRMLATGVSAAGQGFARAQQTINTTPLGGITSAVNNAGQFALGQTLSGSSNELAQFIAERQAQMFDVVYVDTGAEVAVHIDREIPVDYQTHGRKLDYARANPREPGRGGLD